MSHRMRSLRKQRGFVRVSGSGDTTALQDAAEGLNAGESTPITSTVEVRNIDIQWQCVTIFYDATRKEFHLMGKPASSQNTNYGSGDGDAYAHYVYQEASDQWVLIDRRMWEPSLGHVWNCGFDPVNGDYYMRVYNNNYIRKFDRSAGLAFSSWGVTSTGPMQITDEANCAVCSYHPNLFGAGDPGMFIWAARRFISYRISDDTWHMNSPTGMGNGDPLAIRSNGCSVYLPAIDSLICFAAVGTEGTMKPILVAAGAGNSTDAVGEGYITATTEPPYSVHGAGGSYPDPHGKVVAHPSDPNRLIMVLEDGDITPGESKVYTSEDYGTTWNLKGYTHPFNDMVPGAGNYHPFTIGCIPEYDVLVGMYSSGTGGHGRIWKPGD